MWMRREEVGVDCLVASALLAEFSFRCRGRSLMRGGEGVVLGDLAEVRADGVVVDVFAVGEEVFAAAHFACQ
jgi:hypothetical protein